MRLAAAEPHAWRTSAQRLCKYRLLFCCRTADSQENTKAWHFCFAYDIYTGTDKHGGWGSFQKTLSDWTVTAGLAATLNPFFFPFFCLILAAMFSGGQLVDGHRQAEPINEEEEGRGGEGVQQQPWCTWVPHHWMNFTMQTQRCHQLMWFIHCKWELHSGEQRDIFLSKKDWCHEIKAL